MWLNFMYKAFKAHTVFRHKGQGYDLLNQLTRVAAEYVLF